MGTYKHAPEVKAGLRRNVSGDDLTLDSGALHGQLRSELPRLRQHRVRGGGVLQMSDDDINDRAFQRWAGRPSAGDILAARDQPDGEIVAYKLLDVCIEVDQLYQD